METAALIMAGGRGERFWPMSRQSFPKQFLCLTDAKRTMIQATVDRILPLVRAENIFIATNRNYKPLVMEQLPEIPEENILCEPAAKNTAPCIGWGAETILRRKGDSVMIVLPSDHQIMMPDVFRDVLRSAIRTAEITDGLVTLGISPSAPETGYGYIQYEKEERIDETGAHRVRRFVEKPDAETALRYISGGDYLWNSGMFIWKTSAIIREIRKYMPENAAVLHEIAEADGKPGGEETVEELFPKLKAISIDYGVMEKSDSVHVLPASFGWDDVGSWLAPERTDRKDENGSIIRGDAVTVDSRHCIVQGDNRLIALVGVENLIVVDTKDALLICSKDRAGDIRKVVEELKAAGRSELL